MNEAIVWLKKRSYLLDNKKMSVKHYQLNIILTIALPLRLNSWVLNSL